MSRYVFRFLDIPVSKAWARGDYAAIMGLMIFISYYRQRFLQWKKGKESLSR